MADKKSKAVTMRIDMEEPSEANGRNLPTAFKQIP
jgi:hypothetical protein